MPANVNRLLAGGVSRQLTACRAAPDWRILQKVERHLIIVPAYNASGSIGQLIRAIESEQPGLEILVVDDGSVDETSSVARSSGATCLRFSENRGKGAALRAGFAHAIEARYDAVLTMDADLQHDPVEIKNLLTSYCSRRSLVLAVRRREGNMPLQRRLSNSLVSCFSSVLGGRWLRDAQCGFRLIPTELLSGLTLQGTRYELEPELAIKAARIGYPISEVTVNTIYNRNRSSIRPFFDTLRFLKMVFQSLFW
jgi:glycosyltransferase involved in cell wall biosynthesis